MIKKRYDEDAMQRNGWVHALLGIGTAHSMEAALPPMPSVLVLVVEIRLPRKLLRRQRKLFKGRQSSKTQSQTTAHNTSVQFLL